MFAVSKRNWATIGATLFAVLIAMLLIIFIPHRVSRWECKGCTAGERARSAADSRATLVQFLVAIAGAGTIFFTWRNYVRSSREAEANLALGREGRTSDNFIKAVEQLGNNSPAVRARGIFGLGRLLRTATPDGDYWPLM